MTHQPKVAIVILNWNGRKYLEQFLPSVITTSYSNYEIIIADNNSSDDSVSFLETNYPSLRVIHLSTNYGFAKGYNEALKQVQADYYMILNSDVEVHSDWIQPMVDLLESDKTIAACQPKVLSYSNKKLFEYAGAAGGWIDKFGYPFAKGRVFDICEEDHGQYDDVSFIFWVSGAAMFIRSDVFHEVKGFDEYFFAHQEEIDLCWRIQLAGYKLSSCPQSVVYHLGWRHIAKRKYKKNLSEFQEQPDHAGKKSSMVSKMVENTFQDFFGYSFSHKGIDYRRWRLFSRYCPGAFCVSKMDLIETKQISVSRQEKQKFVWNLSSNLVWQHFVKGKKYFREVVKNGF